MTAQWTLEDLYRRIARSWKVLIAIVAVFTLAGAGVFLVYPQTYTASSQHTVEPISVLSSGSSFNTVNMETERFVATSTAVLERASDALGGVSVPGLREATVIDVPRNSQVLIFRVTANAGEKAAKWANAVATAYGEQRTENARKVLDQTSSELNTAIEKLQSMYESQPEGSSARAATQLQLQALLDEQARLSSTPLFSGILVTPAESPTFSNRPSIFVFIAAGLFLGLLLGGITALLVSRFRHERIETALSQRSASVRGGESSRRRAGRPGTSGKATDKGDSLPQARDAEPSAE